jgi:hypothetical protein
MLLPLLLSKGTFLKTNLILQVLLGKMKLVVLRGYK